MPLHLKTCSYFEPAALGSSAKYQPIGGSLYTSKNAVDRISADQYTTYRDYPRYVPSAAVRSSTVPPPAMREYEMPEAILEKPRPPERRPDDKKKKLVHLAERNEAAEDVAAARHSHYVDKPAERLPRAERASRTTRRRSSSQPEGDSVEDFAVKAATRPPQKASKMLQAPCGQCRRIMSMEDLEWHAPMCKRAAKEREQMEDQGLVWTGEFSGAGGRDPRQDVLAVNPTAYSRDNVQQLQKRGQLPTNVAEDRAWDLHAMQDHRRHSSTDGAYLSEDTAVEPRANPPPQPSPPPRLSPPTYPGAADPVGLTESSSGVRSHPTSIPPPQPYVSPIPPVVSFAPPVAVPIAAPVAQPGIFVAAPFPSPRHLTLKESLPELEALIKFVDHVRESDPRLKAKARQQEVEAEPRPVQRTPSVKGTPAQPATPKPKAPQSVGSSDEDRAPVPKPPPAVISVDMYDGKQGTAKQRELAARQANAVAANVSSSDDRPLPRPSKMPEPEVEEVEEEEDDDPQYTTGNPADLVPCSQCSRKFRRDRLKKHTAACKKNAAAAKKRGVFKQSRVDDPSKRGFGGNDSGPFKLYGEAFSGGLGSDDKQRIKASNEPPVQLDRSTKTSDGRFPC
eukprot:EG_transcript_6063